MTPSSTVLEEYKLHLEQYQRTRELYWKRVSVFLAVQGFLFATLTLTTDYPLIGVILGLFGLLFSLVWHGVMMLSELDVVSRRSALLHVEEQIGIQYPIIKMSIEISEQKSIAQNSYIMNHISKLKQDPEMYAPSLVGFLWFLTILYFISIVIGIVIPLPNV